MFVLLLGSHARNEEKDLELGPQNEFNYDDELPEEEALDEINEENDLDDDLDSGMYPFNYNISY